MHVAGILEPDGSVTYGHIEQRGRYGVASDLVDTVAAFEMKMPDRASALAVLTESAAEHGQDIRQAPDVAGYIALTASIDGSPLSMLLCIDGWVGWPARNAARCALYEVKVADLERLQATVGGIQAKVAEARRMEPRHAAGTRKWARDAAADAAAAAMDIGSGPRAPQMIEVELALKSASRRVRTVNLLDDLTNAHSSSHVPLGDSRRTLKELTKHRNWLPGEAHWLESGATIIRGLDAVIDALADAAAVAGSAAAAAAASKRASQRNGAELRRAARSHAEQAWIAAHDAALHHSGLPNVRTGLDDIVKGLVELCRAAASTRDVVTLEQRTRACAERADRALTAARLGRRCAQVAFAATTGDGAEESEPRRVEHAADPPARVSRRLLRQGALA